MSNANPDKIIFASNKDDSIPDGKPWKMLVVDDEPDVHQVTRLAIDSLTLEGRPILMLSAFSGKEAIQVFSEHYDIAIVLLDVVMETEDAGLKTLVRIREELGNKLVRVILRTAQPGIAPEREVVENYDIICYKDKADLTVDKLYSSILAGLKSYRDLSLLAELSGKLDNANRLLAKENAQLKKEVQAQFRPEHIVGDSAKWKKTMEIAEYAMKSDSNILLLGETGTGKELIARLIHYSGIFKDKPFIAVNCAAFSDELLYSELFGHVKGAFTGATHDRKGIFEEADGGSIFLDEICDMTLEGQAKLLRAVQFGEIKRIGENKTRKVNVRVLAATNKDINDEIANNRFRKDLFYRIAVFSIILPPLRERKDDIPVLANAFLRKYRDRRNQQPVAIEAGVLRELTKGNFPGNIRELENELERMANMTSEGKNIDMEIYKLAAYAQSANCQTPDIDFFSFNLDDNFNFKENVQQFEKHVIQKALEACDNNKRAAAELLNLPERTFFNKLGKTHDDE